MLRLKLTAAAGAIALALVALPSASFAGGHFRRGDHHKAQNEETPASSAELDLIGQGTGNVGAPASACTGAGLTCSSGNCQCIAASGSTTGPWGFNKGSYNLDLLVDLSASYKNGGTVCFFSTGALTTSTGDGHDSLTWMSSGSLCNVLQGKNILIVQDTGATVTGGTGELSEATGLGNLVADFHPSPAFVCNVPGGPNCTGPLNIKLDGVLFGTNAVNGNDDD